MMMPHIQIQGTVLHGEGIHFLLFLFHGPTIQLVLHVSHPDKGGAMFIF